MDLNVLLINFNNDTILHIYAYIQSSLQVSITTMVLFIFCIVIFSLFIIILILEREQNVNIFTFSLAFFWVFATIGWIVSTLGYSDKYHELQININNYYTASQNINGFSFDELKNGDIRLNNGKLMKIQRTQVHPDDLLISYEDINIEVENNNGQAETVALFDKDMKEIIIP